MGKRFFQKGRLSTALRSYCNVEWLGDDDDGDPPVLFVVVVVVTVRGVVRPSHDDGGTRAGDTIPPVRIGGRDDGKARTRWNVDQQDPEKEQSEKKGARAILESSVDLSFLSDSPLPHSLFVPWIIHTQGRGESGRMCVGRDSRTGPLWLTTSPSHSTILEYMSYMKMLVRSAVEKAIRGSPEVFPCEYVGTQYVEEG